MRKLSESCLDASHRLAPRRPENQINLVSDDGSRVEPSSREPSHLDPQACERPSPPGFRVNHTKNNHVFRGLMKKNYRLSAAQLVRHTRRRRKDERSIRSDR